MAGIRLHHPFLTSCVYVVELPTPYPQPRKCPTCAKVHENKSIHLRLDSTGHVIVSREIHEKLRKVFLGGLEVANTVERPPPQVVGAVELPTQRIVDVRLNGHKDATPFYVPGRTKYEARDRLRASLPPGLLKKKEE